MIYPIVYYPEPVLDKQTAAVDEFDSNTLDVLLKWAP